MMFSKKLVWAMLAAFVFLSLALFFENMPAPKNKRIYEAILPYFPYQIKKELGGIDIHDKIKDKDLDIANAKVYVVFDQLLKKWGQKHLRVAGRYLIVLDDNGNPVKKIELKNQKEAQWVKEFFGI